MQLAKKPIRKYLIQGDSAFKRSKEKLLRDFFLDGLLEVVDLALLNWIAKQLAKLRLKRVQLIEIERSLSVTWLKRHQARLRRSERNCSRFAGRM